MLRIARLTFRGLTVVFCAFLLVVFCGHQAFAEGSKELVSQGGYRPYIEQYGSSLAEESRITEIGVYVKAGETLYFGSSVKSANLGLDNEKMGTDLSDKELRDLNENHIIVCDPDWDKQTNPNAYPYINGELDPSISLFRVDRTIENKLRGYIPNYEAEHAGPIVQKGDKELNAAGYSAHKFSAEKEGVYHFRFCSVNESTQEPQAAIAGKDENFQRNQGSSTVAAWDVSVLSAEGKLQSGRVFVDELFLAMGSNRPGENVLNSKVYVLTKDAYEYEINFNGLDPEKLKFFSNLRGMLLETEAGYQSLNHSLKSQNRSLSDLVDNKIYNNIKPAEDSDAAHRIFFNPPDSFSLEKFCGSETLSQGTLRNNIENIMFTPALNPESVQDATIVGFGGTLSFVNDGNLEGSSFQITLDFSDFENPDNKVVLSNALVEGVNSVYWNGCDRYGKVVPPGLYEKEALVEIKGGEAHFPLIDVENNKNGIKVLLKNEIAGNDDASVLHYNNLSNIQNYQGAWNEANWTILDGQDMSAGTSSLAGALPYSKGAGAYTSIDLWAYHSLANKVPLRIEVYEASMPFTVSQLWDNSSDTSKTPPLEGSHIDLQLQWRTKDSAEAWRNYDGICQRYHEPIASITQSNYDPTNPVFVGLEQYKGRDIATGKPLLYQYRVVPIDLPENYLLVSSSFSSPNLNGVGYAIDLQYAFLPDSGIISVTKKWENDEGSTRVRPQKLALKLFQRSIDSKDSWEEATLLDDEKQIVLSADNGWSADVPVLMQKKGKKQEFFITMSAYSMNGTTWTSLDSDEKSFFEGKVEKEGRYNAPGYSTPAYAIGDGTLRQYWSHTFALDAQTKQAKLTIRDTYESALHVNSTWETGVSTKEPEKLIVQLLQDGVEVEGATAELSKANPSHSFEGLSIGHKYTTRVLSSDKDYLVKKVNRAGESGYSTIGSKSYRGWYEAYSASYRFTSLTVDKTWSDAVNEKKTTEIKATVIFNDGTKALEQNAKLSQKGKWRHTFSGLPIGGKIELVESALPKNVLSIYGDMTGNDTSGYHQEILNEEQQATITLQKTWRGDEAASDVRPDAVRLQIYFREKGSKKDWKKYDNQDRGLYELSPVNRWVQDVEVERSRKGKALEYYVVESAYKEAGAAAFSTLVDESYAQGYAMPHYSCDGGSLHENESTVVDFENRIVSKVESVSTYTTLFTVVAAWQQESAVPDKITIQLQKDGKDVVDATAILDPKNSTHTFYGLATGHHYSIVEVSKHESFEESYTEVDGEDGYSIISGKIERGYYQGITNIEVAGLKGDIGQDAQNTETGIAISLSVFGVMALGVATYFLIVSIRKKRL